MKEEKSNNNETTNPKKATFYVVLEKHELAFLMLMNMLFVLFLCLEMCEVIKWVWFWVFSPIVVNVLIVALIRIGEQKYIEDVAREHIEKQIKFKQTLEKDLEEAINKKEEKK